MHHILQKLFIAVLVVAIIGIGVQLSKQLRQKYILKQELNQIEKRINELQEKNSILQNKISSLENEDFLKLELKEKFNLKEEGEIVVALKRQQNTKNKILNSKEKEKKNWEKWIEVILGR